MSPFLKPFIKVNSKWIKALNVGLESIKLPDENREKLSWDWFWQSSFGYDTKTTDKKRKNRQVGLHKT